MSFDLETLEPFLKRLTKMVDGFGLTEVAFLMEEVKKMELNAEKEWTFTAKHNGIPTTLKAHIFMDDTTSPDLAFFTSRELASEIQKDMIAYANELGI